MEVTPQLEESKKTQHTQTRKTSTSRKKTRHGRRKTVKKKPTDSAGESQGESSVPAAKKADSPRRRRRRSTSIKVSRKEPETANRKAVESKKSPQKTPAAKTKAPVKAAEEQHRVMIINARQAEEVRIAILHENRLEELYIERQSAESHVGNIYKGRVLNVESSIQAAFIDFGQPKNGFLHISDLQPQYFASGKRRGKEDVGKKVPRRERPPIQQCLKRGQEVIVQITKEGIGTKGPTLTTYLSIPGRYLVMMPGMCNLGVSRKIEDDEDRRKMRTLMSQLSLPKDMGFILRTAGLGRTKRELQADLNYLKRLWKAIAERIKSEKAPAELYQESNLVVRTIRDVYSTDFSKIVVDDPITQKKADEFLKIFTPRTQQVLESYDHNIPIFHKYGIEEEIERINSRHVPLPSGGSLVIDTTEAMVTIDVNSGRFREPESAEATAVQINIEAADEIARQLRLRDLGGVIVCDFIDMIHERNKRAVEKCMRDALKKHKERARILRISQFGLLEMTRQRQRPSIKRSIYQDCPHCHGGGVVKTPESMALDVLRTLEIALNKQAIQTIEVQVASEVAFHLQNRKRTSLYEMEQASRKTIVIRTMPGYSVNHFDMTCTDQYGREVLFETGLNPQ